MKRSKVSSTVARLPNWTNRHLSVLKQTGNLSFGGEILFDLSSLSIPQISSVLHPVRTLDISHTHIVSMLGCPPFPHLTVFIGDHSELSNFTNFNVLKSASTVSLKGTPISKLPTYRLSLLLALGNDTQLVSIDGSQISSGLKANLHGFSEKCNALVNLGWIATVKPPTLQELETLCQKYDIDPPFIDNDSNEDSSKTSTEEEIPDNFGDLLISLQNQHQEMWRKGKVQFGILDEYDDPDFKVMALLRRYGFVNGKVPDVNPFGILAKLRNDLNRKVS
jgi:hypothetical protein